MTSEHNPQGAYRLIKLEENSYRIERLFNDGYKPVVAVTDPTGALYWWQPTPTGIMNGKIFMKGSLEECKDYVSALKVYDAQVEKPNVAPLAENIVYL